ISVLMGHGDGTFAPKADYVTDPAAASMPLGGAVADLDGDGHPDIVVANRGSASVAVLRNDGLGGFGSLEVYQDKGGAAAAPVAGGAACGGTVRPSALALPIWTGRVGRRSSPAIITEGLFTPTLPCPFGTTTAACSIAART